MLVISAICYNRSAMRVSNKLLNLLNKPGAHIVLYGRY